jgi:hypothetical protein
MIALLLLTHSVCTAYKLAEGVTPVQRVLQMMEEMHAKGVEEKAAEEQMMDEYQAWCKETKWNKDIAIRDGGDKVEKEAASQQKATADASALTDSVAQLDAAIAKAAADKQASTKVRDTERADYEALHADYSESISSMGNAISTISANPAQIKNSLLQLPEKTQLAVAALQTAGFGEDAQAFSSSSGGILDTLKDMKGEMSDQRSKAEQDEAQQRNAYELLQQELKMSIDAMSDERDAKSAKSAQRQKDSADAGSEGAAAAQTKEEDEKYLAEVTATCEQKAADFVQRQELRSEELAAIQKAIDIIGSKSVAGKADKHLPKLMQTSFVALRASTQSRMGRVQTFLEERATRTASKYLARAAALSRAGPFDKVVGMIRAMIVKLTEEAGEEAEHKAWCDGELHENKNSRDAKTAEVNALTAQSDKLNAELKRLADEMETLSQQIADLDKAMNEATAQRNKEHNENEEAVADAKEAQAAVKSALEVLKDFYAKAATATALVQMQEGQPAIFDKSYKGMGGASGGVVGMLDVILSDFVRLEQETTAEEGSAAREFKEFSAESNADRKAKDDSLDGKEKTTVDKRRELAQAGRDLKATQEELDAALEYYDKLKPSCLDAGVDFEERTQRREEEIASLQEALKLLN